MSFVRGAVWGGVGVPSGDLYPIYLAVLVSYAMSLGVPGLLVSCCLGIFSLASDDSGLAQFAEESVMFGFKKSTTSEISL